jgi:hypothetical protein
MFRVQVSASRGRLWTPANGSDLPPEQKAAGSNPAGGTTVSAVYMVFFRMFWSIEAKPSAGAFAFIEHLIHRIPVAPYTGSGRRGRASLVPRPAPYS